MKIFPKNKLIQLIVPILSVLVAIFLFFNIIDFTTHTCEYGHSSFGVDPRKLVIGKNVNAVPTYNSTDQLQLSIRDLACRFSINFYLNNK